MYHKREMSVGALVLVVVSVLFPFTQVKAWGGGGCRVFMVFSYHPTLRWHMNAERGLRDALKGEGCLFRSFYMDTKRHPQEAWAREKAREALKEVRDWRPAVVVTFDDNATRLVGGALLGTSLPVVFLGVNAAPEKYGFVRGSRRAPGTNVTGVLERHYFALTFKLMKALVPSIKVCAVISDDSYTSHVALDYCRARESTFPVEIEGYYHLRTFEEWRDRVMDLQKRVDCILVYNALTVRGPDGRVMANRDVYRWMMANSRVPDCGVWESPVKYGLLAGVILTGYYQGYYAGLKVKEILSGKSPAVIPIDRPPRGEIAVNLARARTLGLRLPLGLLLSARIYGGRE